MWFESIAPLLADRGSETSRLPLYSLLIAGVLSGRKNFPSGGERLDKTWET
jgi:hypothetical protein